MPVQISNAVIAGVRLKGFFSRYTDQLKKEVKSW